jgi:hypothetical protein
MSPHLKSGAKIVNNRPLVIIKEQHMATMPRPDEDKPKETEVEREQREAEQREQSIKRRALLTMEQRFELEKFKMQVERMKPEDMRTLLVTLFEHWYAREQSVKELVKKSWGLDTLSPFKPQGADEAGGETGLAA